MINFIQYDNYYVNILRVDQCLQIKVADFGFAKDVYMKDYYRKQGIEKMPIKWMAPEAMYDGISNEKTDVVSVYLYMHIKNDVQFFFHKKYCMLIFHRNISSPLAQCNKNSLKACDQLHRLY